MAIAASINSSCGRQQTDRDRFQHHDRRDQIVVNLRCGAVEDVDVAALAKISSERVQAIAIQGLRDAWSAPSREEAARRLTRLVEELRPLAPRWRNG